jgi:hypothetical protein
MLPAEKWWEIIAAYGAAIWPAQLVFFVASVLIAAIVFLKPGTTTNTIVRVFLAVSLGWVGIVFFLVLGQGLKGNYFFGALFSIAAILFAIDLYRRRMDFRTPASGWQKQFSIAAMLIVLCYPGFSLLFGHEFPRTIVPGTFPCPTTAFALLLLTFALPKVDKLVYFILLFWAIPFPPVIQIPNYGVYEDVIMFGVGIYALIMLIRNWKRTSPNRRAAQPAS